ncbi:DUF1697 domain-containing protein [Vallicoccus soli]|uniref:DUF1697 domain-containing protein n=1 Tax=Vallicoccus soli TaxID=2339232 RepID=UPI0014031B0F|nr:DUF1697 domain-containing protein [Vallicoccus soli]
MRCALLVRAVNVGGRSRLPSADLRRAVEAAGGTQVATYLQSGNAVCGTDLAPDALAVRVEAALADVAGVRTDVLARTGEELAAVVAANPFPDALAQPSWLHVVFLGAPLAPEVAAGLDPAAWLPDRFAVAGREVYAAYAGGSGRSRMSAGLLRGVPLVATARNWGTVRALAERTA